MNRTRALLAAIGAALLLVGAWMISAQRAPLEDRLLVTPTCRVPLTVLPPAGGRSEGSVVIFPGLASNRRLMLTMGQRFSASGLRVFLADLPGHGDNTQPFSFSRVEDCAAETVETLERQRDLALDRTALVGHSMGGAIALRLADRFPTAATIAVSPAPMVQIGWLPAKGILYAPPRRMPVNLLLINGGLDADILYEADQALLRDAGGERTSSEDFAQKRAAQLVRIPGDAHTSLVFDPRVARRSVVWARRALGLSPDRGATTIPPLLGSALGVFGLLLLFPFAADTLAALFRADVSSRGPGQQPEASPEWLSGGSQRLGPIGPTILRWAIVSLGVVLLLQLWIPLRFVRIFTGDYYASFKLLAGLALLLFAYAARRPDRSFRRRLGGGGIPPLLFAAALALLFVLAVGGWVNWQISDLWMNAARWWRFAVLFPLGVPFYLAEEISLGPPASAGAPGTSPRLKRFALFVAVRFITWAAMVLALLVFKNDQLLILLLGAFLALLALAQRFGADAVRRRTGSAAAAALFSAILGAWFIAAVLPLT